MTLSIIPQLKTLCQWTISADGISSETLDDERYPRRQEGM